ncbi:MAG: hypothetical protein K2M78_03265 [Lachnospiraceae bacterium]|nr:hypothetical protein [Lachnospiraceae bacterium]
MAKYCNSFGLVILAIGVIEAVFIWINGSFILFLVALVTAAFNSFIYFAAAELHERLKVLEKNVNVQTPGINIKDVDMQSYIYNTMTDRKLMDNGGWKCAGCGRTNASYVGTCACGRGKK